MIESIQMAIEAIPILYTIKEFFDSLVSIIKTPLEKDIATATSILVAIPVLIAIVKWLMKRHHHKW